MNSTSESLTEKAVWKMPDINVDLNGKLEYSLEIEVPEGTRKTEPKLSLVYNSGNGDGLLGRGWSMNGLHWVSRDVSVGIHYTDQDQYTTTLIGRLVKGSDGKYYGRKESFVRYEMKKDSDNNLYFWEGVDRNGTKFIYGNTVDSKIKGSPVSELEKIWGLTKVEDIYGNGYAVEYGSTEIKYRYGNRLIQINFRDRTRTVQEYNVTSIVGENKIVSGIVVMVDGKEIRKYEFMYEMESITKVDLLKTIKRTEYNKGKEISYYDMNFEYSKNENKTLKLSQQFGYGETYPLTRIPLDNNTKNQCWAGVAACLEAGKACPKYPPWSIACENEKANALKLCQSYQLAWLDPCTLGVKSPYPVIGVGDIDGDGKQELLRLVGDNGGVRIKITKNLDISPLDGNDSPTISGFTYKTYSTLGFGDVNGDGKIDFAYSDGNVLQVMYSNGTSFGSPTPMNNVSVGYSGVNYWNDTPDMRWRGTLIDMNSDGRADYVKPLSDTKIGVHLSNGNGFENYREIEVGRVYVDNGNGLESGLIIDMDGDGTLDYVMVNGGSIDVVYLKKDLSGARLSKSYDVPTGTGDSRNRWFVDINSDGLLDLIVLQSDNILRLNFFNGVDYGISRTVNVSNAFYVTKESLGNNDAKNTKFFIDMNKDGYPDFVRYNNGTVYISYFDGTGYPDTEKKTVVGVRSLYTIADMNGDARPDLIGIKENDGSYLKNVSEQIAGLMESNLAQLLPEISYWGTFWTNIIFFVEQNSINLSSVVDIIVQEEKNSENIMTQIDVGENRRVEINYQETRDLSGAIEYGTGVYPYLPNIWAGAVVKSVKSNQANKLIETESYEYKNVRLHVTVPEEMRNYGFEEKRIYSDLTQMTNIEKRVMREPKLSGLLASIDVRDVGWKMQSSVVNQYEIRDTEGREWYVGKMSIEKEYQYGKEHINIMKEMSYDTYGNLTLYKETKTGAKTTSGKESITTISSTYQNDIVNWRLGKPLTVKKIRGMVVMEDLKYEYGGDTIIEVTKFPASLNNKTTTILNIYGQKYKETNALGQSMTYQYDTDLNEYITETTNSMGLSIKTNMNTIYGFENSITDMNDGTTSKVYDSMNRLVSITPAGETTYSERTEYKKGNDVDSYQIVNKYMSNGYSDGEIVSREAYDILGKLRRKETEIGGGSKLVETSVYDKLGRIVKKSNPYIEGKENPVYTITEYDPIEGFITKVIKPDGNYTTFAYTDFEKTSVLYSNTGDELHREITQSDVYGNVQTREIQGKVITYSYDDAGKLVKIRDVAMDDTKISYNDFGRKISHRDPNTGTIQYSYDVIGNLVSETDPRGITKTFNYDGMNRISKVSFSNGDPDIVYVYDVGENGKGRLTSVVDNAGKVEYGYDLRGNVVQEKRIIDDLVVIFRKGYDIQNRLSELTYPDGTVIHNKYSALGQLSEVSMDSADGTSAGHVVGSYEGPKIQSGKPMLYRKSGNDVVMEIGYDNIHRRPETLVTKRDDGKILKSLQYSYDRRNNITKIQDMLDAKRTQEYVYDNLSRLTVSNGKYGAEAYEYSDGGNLVRKGNFLYKYEATTNKQIVTTVTNSKIGKFVYDYDIAGNMINRNGEILTYNGVGKLKSIENSGEKIEMLYEYNGSRIRKTRVGKLSTVYSFGGLYDISRKPGSSELHTLYIRGMEGDIFAQYNRNDAVLMAGMDRQKCLSSPCTGGQAFLPVHTITKFQNRVQSLAANAYFHLKKASQTSSTYYIVFWFMVLATLLTLYVHGHKALRYETFGFYSETDTAWTLHATPVLLTSILFVFTLQCGNSGNHRKGIPPWVTNEPAGNSDNVPSGPHIPGGGFATGLVPAKGMYFLHPDHLGSISMITDGYKKPITEQNINYKPYGEIDYKDSDGVNLSKYKYTGQEEDKESGLLYYKSRYYDPMLSRFLQADSVVMPDNTQGMNRYMYVVGSPVNFKDDSGKWCDKGILGVIGSVLLGDILIGYAAIGIVYNYTGGGGNCSKKMPNERGAVLMYFGRYITDQNIHDNDKLIRLWAVNQYYEFQRSRGEPTFLGTTRRHHSLALMLMLDPDSAEDKFFRLAAYYAMTQNVKQPQKGIDQGSSKHDLYSPNMDKEENRTSNKRWIKNAWKRARGPDQILFATTGTIIFSVFNFIHDVTHIRSSKYKPHKWKL